MMSHERDRLRSAYLDGELSSREAADFHQTVSPEERVRLALETRLETALVERLTLKSECPPEVWQRVRDRIDNRPKKGRFARLIGWRRAWWAVGTASAAAVLVALVVWQVLRKTWHEEIVQEDLYEVADDVPVLVRSAEVAGDIVRVRSFMAAHGIDVHLKAIPSPGEAGGHEVRLMGARRVHRYRRGHRDEAGVELLFACCGQPVKVILAALGSDLARELAAAQERGQVRNSRVVGGFLAAGVGRHDTKEVLALLG